MTTPDEVFRWVCVLAIAAMLFGLILCGAMFAYIDIRKKWREK